MGHIIVIISYRLSYHIAYIFSTKKHPSISARVPQIPFLYSYFKSVLEFEHNIIFCLYNHFLHKTAPNPGIELVGYAILLLQSSNEPFEQFLLSICSMMSSYLAFAFSYLAVSGWRAVNSNRRFIQLYKTKRII